jgi:hypothetical protein
VGNKSRKAKAGVKWAAVRDAGAAQVLPREEFARLLRLEARGRKPRPTLLRKVVWASSLVGTCRRRDAA